MQIKYLRGSPTAVDAALTYLSAERQPVFLINRRTGQVFVAQAAEVLQLRHHQQQQQQQ